MKKLYTIILIISAVNLLSAQNQDYDSWIYRFYSWEGGTFGNCWESGTEEYSRKGWVELEGYGEVYSGCNQCNSNGNCDANGLVVARQTQYNQITRRVRFRIDAWEDDGGGRCDYDGGDDCRTQVTSGWYNFPTPLEYQWTQNSGDAGDGDHRTYFRYQTRYATTSLTNAVDNASFGFSTGGNRAFWGSLGSWANSGGDCATSGTITDNQTSSFSTTVNCIDQISFQWRVSSENGWDFLRFFIDGVEQNAISGTPGWATVTYPLDPNTDHTLEWRYTKDGSVSSGDDRGYVDNIIYSNYTIPLAGTGFGANTWNVAAYNGGNIDLAGITYRGYYTENNLNVFTQSHWNTNGTPSDAPSYNGCSVGVDNHTTVHRRQGFPCSTYRIDVAGHDDEIRIYVDGAQVFEHIGCCDAHAGIWQGVLDASSTVEIRTVEGVGGSNTSVNFVPVAAPINAGSINGNQTICSGTNANFGNTGAASGGHGGTTYQWQLSTTNCSSGWSNIGGATGPTYAQTVNQTSYFRRGAVDDCGNVSYTNCVTVNMTIPPGNPAVFGSNMWNVYAYNGQDINLGGGLDYRGYYVDNNLNINTSSFWANTPSTTTGYNGCFVNNDYHTTVHKRQGFTCGQYRLDILGHDDEIRVYVDGAQVYEHLGCCDAHAGVWTGLLDGSSTVEVRTGEAVGGSYTQINLVDITNLVAGTINSNQAICSGDTPAGLTSGSNATGAAGTITYQWQQSTSNCSTGWSNISAATATTYTPPALTQTTYYRRRVTDECGNIAYSNCVTISVHPPLNSGTVAGNQTACAGSALATLTSTANATGGNGFAYQWQSSTNNSTWSNIGGATSASYLPLSLSSTMYYRRRATSNCGEVLYTNTITVTIQTLSTVPAITPIVGKICPNTDFVLSASGGIVGTGSTIEWYSDAAGTVSIGSGNNITVSPTSTTTYYARREGACNTTGLASVTATVKDYIYTPVGNALTSDYCDDNAGWRHFYDVNDDIILSVQGDFSGLASMTATVNNNGTYHQETESTNLNPSNCTNGWSPGEERFELPRYWNVDYTGTLSGNYKVRYYFPAAEKANLITTVNNFIATWTDCNYGYKHPYPDGFYWFKNTGLPYTTPQFEGTFLTGAGGAVNGINYSEISGVTSFSGGSGAIIVVPTAALPIELLSFVGKNQGQVNLLNWTTETETNNARFEIEHSLDPATGFEPIGQLKGAGTTQELQRYNFTHNTPSLGINYYRLKQIDFDGESSYSEVIAITVEQDERMDAFYPNPTENIVNYQFNETVEQEVTIVINNTLGQVVRELNYSSKVGINTVSIDLSTYPAGAYLIKVSKAKSKISLTKRIIRVD